MFERFTERARRAMFYAEEFAAWNGEFYISTEHLLRGVLKEPSEQLINLFTEFKIDISKVIKDTQDSFIIPVVDLEKITKRRPALTPRTKRSVDMAYDEARQMNLYYPHDTHLFLGLLREGSGLAGRILKDNGFEFSTVKQFLNSQNMLNSQNDMMQKDDFVKKMKSSTLEYSKEVRLINANEFLEEMHATSKTDNMVPMVSIVDGINKAKTYPTLINNKEADNLRFVWNYHFADLVCILSDGKNFHIDMGRINNSGVNGVSKPFRAYCGTEWLGDFISEDDAKNAVEASVRDALNLIIERH